MSKFDECMLQRAETFNMNSFAQQIITHFINEYEVNCKQENCYVCALVWIVHFDKYAYVWMIIVCWYVGAYMCFIYY